ncbi:MAG: biopolymer transporter ExbD [Sphingomonadales bacterium]|jgi:biopolymer transport protein ExbD|uniref:ExbD/TolR family protein n=1 Tax=Sphingomonas asaccharolytica TaxID=40681 RepID=UPI000831AC92|nr:biopolymer transporter ExbD [Sphingomonas asaccharolytica]MBW8842215.1 biopolymer transporter ExbD [Sphingomonadales bacterium]
MAMSGGRDDGAPMMDMNMTPLIDVLLVLLIMFIITIPVQTHAVKVDLPVNQANNPPPVDAQKNKIIIDANDNVTWNGTPVTSDEQLDQYLQATLQIQPEPELHFQPLPDARYEKVDKVLAVIKRSGISKLGFIGNEQYANEF